MMGARWRHKPTRALTAKQGRGLNSSVDVGFPHTCLLCEKQGHAVIDCSAEICTVNGERRASPRYLLSIGKCKADGSACQEAGLGDAVLDEIKTVLSQPGGRLGVGQQQKTKNEKEKEKPTKQLVAKKKL